MKCQYVNPTIQQCNNCQFDDCIRPETQDINEQKAEWRRKNPDKRKAIRRRYYLSHKERELQYGKQYYDLNIRVSTEAKEERHRRSLEKMKQYQKQYRQANAEKMKQYKKVYHEENKEKISQKAREYYKRKKAERVS